MNTNQSNMIKPKADPTVKNPRNYINNKDFYQALVDYRELRLKNEDKGLPPPKPSEFLGRCFMQIANKLSSKHNFFGYTFRDEMVADALEMCVRYMNAFDPTKSTNPFSYFTATCWSAFIKRIKGEKTEYYTRAKLMQNAFQGGTFDADLQGEGDEIMENFAHDMDSYDRIVGEFESREITRKAKAREKNKTSGAGRGRKKKDVTLESFVSKD